MRYGGCAKDYITKAELFTLSNPPIAWRSTP